MHFLLADYYLINAIFFEIACFDNYDYWTNKVFLDKDFHTNSNQENTTISKTNAYGHGAVEVSRTLQGSSD